MSTTNTGLFDHSSIVLVFLFSCFFLKLFWRTHFPPFMWNTDTRPLKDKAHTLGILSGEKTLKTHFAGDKLLGTFFFFNRIKGTFALLRQQYCFLNWSPRRRTNTQVTFRWDRELFRGETSLKVDLFLNSYYTEGKWPQKSAWQISMTRLPVILKNVL